MSDYLWIFLGGGLGAALRYWMQALVHDRTGTLFPYGTLTVNAVGCFAIGLCMIALQERFLAAPQLRLFLTIGVLGGFTTFSSFSFETMNLVRNGEMMRSLANVGASLAACLCATWIGMAAGRHL